MECVGPRKPEKLGHQRGRPADTFVQLGHSTLRGLGQWSVIRTRSPLRILPIRVTTGAFAMWAPKLYDYYRSHLGPLFKAHPSLRRNFMNSVWTTITFNFGPRTVCYVHRDPGNLAFGWCAITALGRFDPKRSGHLILWDMKLVIEFPPGSTILIPSATLRHSNVRLQEGESRVSFTQYTSGGLFRWVENGFRTNADFEKQDKKGKMRADKVSETRWEEGLKLFSTLDELRN
jgi:hypothetical protein